MNNNRMMWVDSLKGFLMLLVIWSHSKAYIDPPGYFLTAGYMGVFFFLTGYTTLNWNTNGVLYIKKKAIRLLTPYCVYGVMITLLQITVSIFKGTLDLYQIVRGFLGFLYNAWTFDKLKKVYFLIWDNGPFWFLTAMFLACIYAWLFFYFWNKGKKSIAVSFLIIMSVLLNCNTRYMLPWGMDSAFIGAVLIVLGSFYRKYLSDNKLIINNPIPCAAVSAILLYLLTKYKGVNMAVKEYGQSGLIGVFIYILISVISSILCLIIFSNCRERGFIMKCLQNIGKETITLLCIQMFVIRISDKLMFSVTENRMFAGWISIIMTLFCGGVLNYIMKKIKCKKLKWVEYL